MRDRNGEVVQCGDVVMVKGIKCKVIKATLNDQTFLVASSLKGKPKIYRLAPIFKNYLLKCV